MDFDAVTDPLALLDDWRTDAEKAGIPLPEAMTLSTVGLDGGPQARVVLLKARVGRELHFFTNYQSDKARELEQEPRASLLVHYAGPALQARVCGVTRRLSDADNDAYFATRPRLSQIGAWASDQSRALDARETLEKRVAEFEAKFDGAEVPRPAHWGGYALEAGSVELWVGQMGRLHDRARFSFEDQAWRCQLLCP